MSEVWTTARVLALAPDASSASAGQGLASASKWTSLGCTQRTVWGLCQGSGKSPYQTRVDLSGPAFKCSCPSRKFPCKHALGLMLLLAAGKIKDSVEPSWVSEWIASRQEKAEQKAEKAEAKAAEPVDPEAQAKRRAQRDRRVQDGIRECSDWLEDLVRRGLAAAQIEESQFWERAAARMVDAQAPGLAALLRRVQGCVSSGDGWQVRTLHEIGRLHLLLEAGAKLDTLPALLATDVRTALGFTQQKDEILSDASACVSDRWVVAGQVMEEDNRLTVRRTWLVGRQSSRRALILDFAAGNQPLSVGPLPGTEVDAELAFFPSSCPQRAIVKSSGAPEPARTCGACADETWEGVFTRYASAVAANPWLLRWPVVLEGARVALSRERAWMVMDRDGVAMPVGPRFGATWKLAAMTGGATAMIAGEWDGEFFTPFSVMPSRGQLENISPRWAA